MSYKNKIIVGNLKVVFMFTIFSIYIIIENTQQKFELYTFFFITYE